MEGVGAGVAWMGDCGILELMMTCFDSPQSESGATQDALGRGVYDAGEVARLRFPLGLDRRSLVIDPARAFGRPVATESGIPAEVLADAVAVEGSVADAARAYEVPISVVKDAVRFRERLVA